MDAISNQGHLLIVSGASGAGKSTLCERLRDEFPSIRVSVSYTTRAPRGEEVDGVHYHFVSKGDFDAMIRAHEFVEYALVHGNYYGTARHQITSALKKGHVILFDVDYQGAEALKEQYRDALSVMILPPSIESLLRRLVARRTDSQAVIAKRVGKARDEIRHYTSFDYLIVNDEVDPAYQALRAVLLARTAKATTRRDGVSRKTLYETLGISVGSAELNRLEAIVSDCTRSAKADFAERLLREEPEIEESFSS